MLFLPAFEADERRVRALSGRLEPAERARRSTTLRPPAGVDVTRLTRPPIEPAAQRREAHHAGHHPRRGAEERSGRDRGTPEPSAAASACAVRRPAALATTREHTPCARPDKCAVVPEEAAWERYRDERGERPTASAWRKAARHSVRTSTPGRGKRPARLHWNGRVGADVAPRHQGGLAQLVERLPSTQAEGMARSRCFQHSCGIAASRCLIT